MGYEQKAKEEMEKVGRYNVHIKVVYDDLIVLEGDYKEWQPHPQKQELAMIKYDGNMVIAANYLYYEVSKIKTSSILTDSTDVN